MRKFYKLVRIDLHLIEGLDQNKTMPMYMPVDPTRPEFFLGYFSSKRKALDQLIEVCPEIKKGGTMKKPFYDGFSSRGHWEGWLVHDRIFTRASCYMLLEIETD